MVNRENVAMIRDKVEDDLRDAICGVMKKTLKRLKRPIPEVGGVLKIPVQPAIRILTDTLMVWVDD